MIPFNKLALTRVKIVNFLQRIILQNFIRLVLIKMSVVYFNFIYVILLIFCVLDLRNMIYKNIARNIILKLEELKVIPL